MIDVAVLSFTVLFLLTTSAIVLVLSVSQNFERYSRKCADYRLTVQSRVAQLANSCNRIACKVQPFERMEAEHYKTIYESTQTHWHVAQQERRNAIFQLRRWVFPVEVPSALSMSERLTFFGYATSSFIGGCSKLAWIELRLTFFAKPSITRARQEVARLLRAPEQLRIQCKRVLNERIPNLESSIEHETGKGIHMTDLASTLEELGQQIDTVCPQLRLDARVSPEHLDKTTQEFEDAVELLEKLESKVQNIHKCRINIDQQMEEAGKHSRSIVDSIAQKGFLPRYLPIVQRTSALIAKAQRLRVERDFSGAAQSLAASQQIVELGATLSETQTLVDYLEHVKGISLTRTEMEATIDRFDKVFSRCCSHVRFGEIRDLYQDVIRIQSEAKNLKEAHDDKTAELERAAEREWRKLEGQWQALQGIASLRSDLLASNFNSLLQKRSAIPGKPVLLQQFNQEVARLACRMQEVHSGLRKQMLAANLRINNLKAEAFSIDLMSTKWSCLAPFAAHIRSGVSNTKDMLSDICHLTTYDEVISKFRSIRSELKELEQVYGRMSDQCGRLNKMEGIVKACTQLLENEDWKDRTESVRRRITVILQQLQNSKRDPQLDQAYAYLQNAHDAVWELIATLPPADVKRYTVIIEGGAVYGLNIGDRPTIYQSFGLSSIL